jgi:hypothetical protein
LIVEAFHCFQKTKYIFTIFPLQIDSFIRKVVQQHIEGGFLLPDDGRPLPDPPPVHLLLLASHGEVESVPELEVLGYIDDDVAGGVDDQH